MSGIVSAIVILLLFQTAYSYDDLLERYIEGLESLNVLIIKKSAHHCPPRLSSLQERRPCPLPSWTSFYTCIGKNEEICQENQQAYDIIMTNYIIGFSIITLVSCVACICLSCFKRTRHSGHF